MDGAVMFRYVMAALVAGLAVMAAGYVHLRLPYFTATPAKLAAARAILIAVGIACGYVGAQMYREPVDAVLAFIIGFGVVHLPATAILFLKGQRGEGSS